VCNGDKKTPPIIAWLYFYPLRQNMPYWRRCEFNYIYIYMYYYIRRYDIYYFLRYKSQNEVKNYDLLFSLFFFFLLLIAISAIYYAAAFVRARVLVFHRSDFIVRVRACVCVYINYAFYTRPKRPPWTLIVTGLRARARVYTRPFKTIDIIRIFNRMLLERRLIIMRHYCRS